MEILKKKHTKEARKKMVEGAKLRDKSTYHKIVNTREWREKHSKRMTYLLHNTDTYTKAIQKWIVAGQKNCKKSRKTKIENIIYKVLKDLGLKNIKRNTQINYHNVDFLVNDTIIECYGDYWHCNPTLFDKEYFNKGLKMSANAKWLKDKMRQTILEMKGYKYIYFWESDIHNNLKNVIQEICKHFNLKNQKYQ